MTEKLFLTNHAVERFVKCVRPDLRMPQARHLLQARLPDACPLRQRPYAGDALWMLEDPPCVLISRRSRFPREDGRQPVVSVLPAKLEEPGPEAEWDGTLPLWTALARMLVFLQEGKVPQELVEAVDRLVILTVEHPIRDLSAAPLLRGFELLADAVGDKPTKRRKLEQMRDALRLVLGHPPQSSLREVILLWSDIIRLAGQAACERYRPRWEQQAWQASAAAWREGLRTLLSMGIERQERGEAARFDDR